MVVPGGMINIHKANAALDEPSRQQTVSREGAELARTAAAIGLDLWVLALDSVGFESGFGFAGQIDQLRRGALHAKGEFVGSDSAGDFGISDLLVTKAVQIVDCVQPVMLHLRSNSRRVAQIQDRLALIAEQN